MSQFLKKLVRFLTAWAWHDFLLSVSRVEWKYGRSIDGTPKDWQEWIDVRTSLKEVGQLRAPYEVSDQAKVKK